MQHSGTVFQFSLIIILSNYSDLLYTNITILYVVAVSDAEETIAWMVEKDPMLSTDDYGRDLASVQALQRKHDTLERDLNALEEKVG